MFFDPNSDLDVKNGGNLPHWHQNNKIQFVTFRLADSLPANVALELKNKIDQFKRLHPAPWNFETKRKYWQIIGAMEERLLDNGYGSCVLKNRDVRDIVTQAILYRDTMEYNILSFVIMPNHVHILIQPLGNITLSRILHSIKRFTSVSINKLLKRSGKLWMPESFDRIVRSPEQLKHYIQYIQHNPEKLPSDQFTIYFNLNFDYNIG